MYPVISLPPFIAGADHVTTDCALAPEVAETPVGVSGTVAKTTTSGSLSILTVTVPSCVARAKRVKEPSKTLKGLEPAKTLEAYHTSNITKIKEEQSQLEMYKSELKEKQTELEKVEKEFNGPSLITNASDIAILMVYLGR